MNTICPHCGKATSEESPRFCSGCGARMDGTTPPGCPAPGVPQKNPLIAGFCSSFLPGLGQVCNGETVKGFVIFFLAIAGAFFLLIPGLLVWLYAMYDAYAVAGKMNAGEIEYRETRILHMILFIVFALVVIGVLLIIILTIIMAGLMAGLGPLGIDNSGMFDTSGLF